MRTLVAVTLALLAATLCSADFMVVEDHDAACAIVLPADAHPAVQRAAEEL
ncbi:MAG: hypothetical protein GF393_11430, partial [Armatimonadia bacterium]|nr:hypothetical protein [Armatimonadia bacterium]